jgi:hypothetical protein
MGGSWAYGIADAVENRCGKRVKFRRPGRLCTLHHKQRLRHSLAITQTRAPRQREVPEPHR